MLVLDLPSREALRGAVLAAANQPDVHVAIRNFYLALQDQIELRRPVCATSGRCCRFDEFGHRLFVTTMELAMFIHGLERPVPARSFAGACGCPFQQNKLCSVHATRPFGCRIFFCDETSTEWQRQQYEFFHAELKRLHERLRIPYFYVEWRQALQAVGIPEL